MTPARLAEEGSFEESLVADALQLQIRVHELWVAQGGPTLSSPVAVWATLTLARQQHSGQISATICKTLHPGGLVETDFGQSDFGQSDFGKPTLAKPTLADVKVVDVCKDFGFSELIVWVF